MNSSHDEVTKGRVTQVTRSLFLRSDTKVTFASRVPSRSSVVIDDDSHWENM